MESVEAAEALNVQADLIYIDAAHDTENVTKDILAWYPHLKENGFMCGDDWRWPSVQVAVTDCAQRLNKQVGCQGTFWWFYD
jgi:hypothetical protein